jgi:aspartyl-tRNA(Asn)/glutamyl-tRNA(Gln) amidotransferase subunit A
MTGFLNSDLSEPGLSVTAIAALAAGGQGASQSIMRRSLDAITSGNDRLHAFVEVFADAAMRRAEELDRIADLSGPVGPLHGVPIAVKDLAAIAGRAAGFGSKCYGASVAASTAPAIQRLMDAGAIIIGMTHMVEFAIGGWGTNHAMGTPWNPIDPDVHRVPGGSSSGSAVAVAAGWVPAAIGSDTGGSIRIPASLCGLVGLKPSDGLIPLDGIAQLSPTFDTLGPITRTVADARLLAGVMAAQPLTRKASARPLRIGTPAPRQLEPCDPDVLENHQRSIRRLEATGHVLESFSFPLEMMEYQAMNGAIVAFEAYRQHRRIVEDLSTPLDPFVRQRVLSGREIDEKRYAELLAARRDAAASFRSTHGHLDVIALPSTPMPAIPVSMVDETTIPMSRYTRMANCLALCALSLPNGVTSSGLPTGLQLLSWPGEDALMLDLADEILARSEGR